MKNKEFSIVSLNISEKTGEVKKPIDKIMLVEGKGVHNDAHFDKNEDRQVSFLAYEDIEESNRLLKLKDKSITLKPGDFAENITTRNIKLHELKIGEVVHINDVVLEVSKIGKSCHSACNIKNIVGDCIMPKRGIFMRVIKGGVITNEDTGYCYI